MVFYCSLSDSKSPQVSRSRLSILDDLNNGEVWIVLIRPVISKSYSPCTNSLMTVPRASIIIGITVTFMFERPFFFSIPFQCPGTYPSFRFLSVLICCPLGQQSSRFCKFSFFVVDYYQLFVCLFVCLLCLLCHLCFLLTSYIKFKKIILALNIYTTDLNNDVVRLVSSGTSISNSSSPCTNPHLGIIPSAFCCYYKSTNYDYFNVPQFCCFFVVFFFFSIL